MTEIIFNPRHVAKNNHDTLLQECKSFMEEKAKKRNTIQEAVFVTTYLPMFFVGGATEDEKGAIRLPLRAWIEQYAGSAYNEVDVVDTNGEVLFTVPPLSVSVGTYQSDLNNAAELGHVNAAFADAAISVKNESDLHGAKLAGLSEKFLNDLQETTSSVREEIRARWYAIYSRYNLIPSTVTEMVAEDVEETGFSGETDLL